MMKAAVLHEPVRTDTGNVCGRCGAVLDAATGINGRVPAEGDVSICADCGLIMVFGRNRKLRKATRDEMDAILFDIEIDDPDTFRIICLLRLNFQLRRIARERQT
jgi:hypothetical protein